MRQVAALTNLINLAPINQLVDGAFSTIWIRDESRAGIFGRKKGDNPAASLGHANVPVLVDEFNSVLAGGDTVDVEVAGTRYGITKAAVVGGTEYVITEHARIPPAQRGEPTITI